jgi:cell division protein FtsZ
MPVEAPAPTIASDPVVLAREDDRASEVSHEEFHTPQEPALNTYSTAPAVNPQPLAPPHLEAPTYEPVNVQPEAALARPPRMPRIDELPMTVQNQLQAQLDQAHGVNAPVNLAGPMPAEQKRMTLLQRLASVGLGATRNPRDAHVASAPTEPLAPVAPRAPAQSSVHQEYAKRVNAGAASRTPQAQLDPMGRPASVARATSEEEQFEIPAFLRRQSS